MTQFGQSLLSEITATFTKRIKGDRKLKAIANRVRDGTSYEVANEYSVRVGEIMSESILEHTENLAYMSKEVAEEVIPPVMTAGYDTVSEAAAIIQANMNAADGVGLGVLTPDLDTNRIAGIVDKVSSYNRFSEAKWVLKEPMVNYSQAIVDQAIRKNAESSGKVGLKSYIRRTSESGACKWCEALEGVYEYPNVPRDVYRRHAFCRCTVTFERGKERQNVWNKREWSEENVIQQTETVQTAMDEKAGMYYPPELGGAKRGEPMTIEKADSGNVNPNLQKEIGYRINCQSCVVTYEARLRGYDVEVLPNTRGSMLEKLSRRTELAWKNADGTPARFLIGDKIEWDEMNAARKYYTAKTFEAKLHETLVPGERYDISFPWKGRSHSGHIVTIDISQDNVLHIYDPQIDKNYYGKEVSAYLNQIKYKQSVFGTYVPSHVRVMRVDDKSFDMEVCNQIMKAK